MGKKYISASTPAFLKILKLVRLLPSQWLGDCQVRTVVLVLVIYAPDFVRMFFLPFMLEVIMEIRGAVIRIMVVVTNKWNKWKIIFYDRNVQHWYYIY